MPSKSDKQKRLMAAVANNPEFAKKVGIPQSVGKEYEREDKKMNCGSKRNMRKGGKVGMHKMPDGTMMPGKKHGMKEGGKVAQEGRFMRDLTGTGPKGKQRKVEFAPQPPSYGVTQNNRPKPVYKKGGKVRGAGMAKKGVRPCKMR